MQSAVWFRACKHKKDASKTTIVKKYIAFWLNKMESEAMGDDVVILMDLTSAGLANTVSPVDSRGKLIIELYNFTSLTFENLLFII